MSAALLLAPVLLPALLAALLAVPRLRRVARALAAFAALPALLLAALAAPGLQASLPWLLLGTLLGLDGTQRIVLLFTALLWTVAGVYARAYHRHDRRRRRFFAFFLVTMAGNLGLVLAQDVASFYFCFLLMSFAAYGLVVHAGTPEARHAGLVYIVLVVAGELFLLPSIWYVAASAPTLELAGAAASVALLPARDLVLAGILLGFGIKAGALPLHVWLPLAHPVAPTPASAVLSGCMIKAGLLAWLRFLPLGQEPLPAWATLVVAFGLAAAFYGVALGLTQERPKTLLAYSSISQMGLVTVAVGLGLLGADTWTLAGPAALAYAFHHALAKGALFLGVGVVEHAGSRRRRALLLLGLPALALAGAPFTSGALAKTALKEAAYVAPAPLAAVLDLLLPLAAIGTTLLMARFLVLMARARPKAADAGLWRAWLPLLAAVALLAWLPPVATGALVLRTLVPAALWAALWPLLAGLALAALVASRPALLGPLARLRLPAGDWLLPAEALGRRIRPALRGLAMARPRPPAPPRPPRRFALWRRAAARAEAVLAEGATTALLLLGLVALLLAAGLTSCGGPQTP